MYHCRSKALYSHNREVKRCGYLPTVRYPGRYLCPPYKYPVNINEVNDWDETVWIWKRYLSCVSCLCTLGLGNAFIPFWMCRVVVRLVMMGCVSLLCIGRCSCVRCSLAWVVVSLCGRVLAPIDVISGRRAVSDRSSGSVLGFISYLIVG